MSDAEDAALSISTEPEDPHSFARRFTSNAAWMLIGQVGAKVASFAFFVIVARGLGIHEYGYFTFTISFVPLFLMFGMWGLEITVVREVARSRDRVSELFASGFIMRIVLGVVALGLAAAFAPFFLDGAEAYTTLAIVGVALFVDELSGFVGTVFKAFERMKFFSLVILANRILSALLAFVAFVLNGSIVMLSLTYLVGSTGAFVVAWILLKKRFPKTRLKDFRVKLAVKLLRDGIPLGVAGVLNMAVFRIDFVLLQILTGSRAVGMYGAAYRFLESFLFVAWTLTSVVLPRMSRQGAGSRVARTHGLTLALILSFYLPFAVGSWFLAPWAVTLLFSERYEPAAQAVPWLTSAAVFYGIAYLSRVTVIGVGSRQRVVWIAAVALAVNVVANLLVIPRYGFTGAAIATFATEVLEAALLVRLVVQVTGSTPFHRALVVPVVAAAVMGAVLWATGADAAGGLLLGVCVYGISILSLGRWIAPAEAARLLQLFRASKSSEVRP
jgi:O-antigen/teichoic acid export membrane protein